MLSRSHAPVKVEMAKARTLVAGHIGLAALCVCADWLVENRPRLSTRVWAPFDTAVHGVVAAAVWFLGHCSSGDRRALTGHVIACLFVACLMDLDHFIAAGSLKLEDALSLESRPFGHSLIFAALVATPIYVIGRIRESSWRLSLPLAVFVSLFSHQLRDAWRRGLWLGWNVTIVVPYWAYVVGIVLLPLIVRWLLNRIYALQAPKGFYKGGIFVQVA
eukprot:Opistho-2@50658